MTFYAIKRDDGCYLCNGPDLSQSEKKFGSKIWQPLDGTRLPYMKKNRKEVYEKLLRYQLIYGEKAVIEMVTLTKEEEELILMRKLSNS